MHICSDTVFNTSDRFANNIFHAYNGIITRQYSLDVTSVYLCFTLYKIKQ